MTDANSALLDTLLMETNSHNNDWGTRLNSNFNIIDRAGGLAAGTIVTTGGVVARTKSDLVEPIQRITGALASDLVVEVPATLLRSNIWINETTGNFNVNVRVTGQSGVNIPRGDTKFLRCNGTDVVDTGIPSYSQISGLSNWLGSTSGINTYTIPANAYIQVLSDGLQIACLVAGANTGPATLNFNSTGAKPIVHSDGLALAGGDIPAGSVKSFTYNLAGDKWFMAEVSASTLAKASGNNNWTAAQTFSGDITLTGNVIETPSVLTDAATIAWDMGATSRNVQVSVAASRNFGTPTNQVIGQSGRIEIIQPGGGNAVITFPAEFDPMGSLPLRVDMQPSARTVLGYTVVALNVIQLWPIYKSSKNSIGFYRELTLVSIPSAGVVNMAHLLGVYPALVQVYLECAVNNNGFLVGDRLLIGDLKDADNHRGYNVGFNATNVFIRVGENEPYILNTTGNTNLPLPTASWRFGARVYE